MINNYKKKILFILALLFIISTLVAAQELPENLQKIIEHNLRSTEEFAKNITFFIAFVAGMLGILSPCILPFIPAYFSYTFKEKRNITRMTLVFFFGFSLVFVSMGVIAGFLGSRSLLFLQKEWLMTIIGLVLIGLGIFTMSGRGFSSIVKSRKFSNDVPGTFLFGVFFAIGWTACLGPILAGILGIGALLHHPGTSALLLFFYSLGNLVPLFVLSLFWDRFRLQESRFVKGKVLSFHFGDDTFRVHSTNLISGLLFIFTGAVIAVYKGTRVFNDKDFLGTKQYFYDIQNAILKWQYANVFAMLIFFLFIAILGRYVWKLRK